MSKDAVLFGSIGAVAETSEIQREAYNQALSNAGLDWQWDRETYSELLEQSGGKERLSMLAAATGADLTQEQIDDIHADKTRIAGEIMRERGIEPRPGVAELIEKAKGEGKKVAFVTTTYEPNLEALFQASNGKLSTDDFDYIGTRDDVATGKPCPEAYERALDKLEIDAENAVAIEDTANSVMSAKRAGVYTIATPGELTSEQDFWQADVVVDSLCESAGSLRPEVANALA